MKKGAIVVVDFSRIDLGAFVRPALVVQNDQDNARLQKTVVVQITSNLMRASSPTNLLIDQSHPDWQASGLEFPSLITCSNILSVERYDVIRFLGSLSAMTMNEIDECLKAVFRHLVGAPKKKSQRVS